MSDTLFATEQLSTGRVGQLTFHTNHLYRCRESVATADVVLPISSIAIRHVRGVTWCIHRKGDPRTWLRIKNARIRTNGTIVGLSTTPAGTTVKLANGSATVVTLNGRKILVPPSTQLFVPISRAPGRPTGLALTADDALAVSELEFDVVAMGAAQTSQYLNSHGEASAVVVGDSDLSAAKMANATGVSSASLTATQVKRDPRLVDAALEKFKAHTIFVAGSPSICEPTWRLLRSAADLPIGTALVYVPL